MENRIINNREEVEVEDYVETIRDAVSYGDMWVFGKDFDGTELYVKISMGMPNSRTIGKIIVTIRNKQCMLALLEASRSEFQDSEYEKVRTNIMCASEFSSNVIEQQLFYGHTTRGMMNGFSEMNSSRLQAMVRYLIVQEGGNVCPTKLNKEMFYADFLHFRRHSRSISGLQYRAIQYGPVPEHYDTIYDNIEGVTKESVISHDNESIRLCCSSSRNLSILTKEELDTLTCVSSLLKPMKTASVMELSHQEEAWENHAQNHQLIPYREAYRLKAIV